MTNLPASYSPPSASSIRAACWKPARALGFLFLRLSKEESGAMGAIFSVLRGMDLRNAPMLLPAAAFAAGTLLAFQASYLPVSLLAILALLSLALGRRAGICLAFLSLGLLAAVVRLDLSPRPADRLRLESPVEAVVKIAGHWTADGEGW